MKQDKGFVYVFYDNVGRVLYVGSTGNIRKRLSSHFNNLNNGKMTICEYQKVELISYAEVGTRNDAYMIEKVMIDKLKPIYNTTDANKTVTILNADYKQLNMKYIKVVRFTRSDQFMLIFDDPNEKTIVCNKMTEAKRYNMHKTDFHNIVTHSHEYNRIMEILEDYWLNEPNEKTVIVSMMFERSDGAKQRKTIRWDA